MGGGGSFTGIAPYLLHCGINLVGVMDANKKGRVEFQGGSSPVLSVEEAKARFGKDAVVIVTVANLPVMMEVEEMLVRHGFRRDKIFDMNIWTWLTTSSEKSYCPYVGSYLQFFPVGLSKCCNIGVVDAFICEWYIKGQTLRISTENFLKKQEYYYKEGLSRKVPLYCKNCVFLNHKKEFQSSTPQISQFITSDHALCNSDCVYCVDGCSVPRRPLGFSMEQRFSGMVDTLEMLQERELIASNAVLQIASGEITINPQKEKLYALAKKNPGYQIEILSNCFSYDEEVAQILSMNPESILRCDLDAGTPENYIKVKGFNKYYEVIENLKKYQKCCSVELKYIVLPGWNDTDSDYHGAISLMKELNLRKLELSPEFRLSRDGDRFSIRKVLYATARFISLLEEAGMEAFLRYGFWKKQDIAIARRMANEIRSLKEWEQKA